MTRCAVRGRVDLSLNLITNFTFVFLCVVFIMCFFHVMSLNLCLLTSPFITVIVFRLFSCRLRAQCFVCFFKGNVSMFSTRY